MPETALLALHNLKEANFRLSTALGGMPMPSLAVLPAGQTFDLYGEITLIAPISLVDPSQDPAVSLFSADVYSPHVPKPVWQVDDQAMAAFEQALRASQAESGGGDPWGVSYRKVPSEPEGALRALRHNSICQLAWLRASGWDEALPQRSVRPSGLFTGNEEAHAFLRASGTRSLDTQAMGKRIKIWLGSFGSQMLVDGKPSPMMLECLELDRRLLLNGYMTEPDPARVGDAIAAAVAVAGPARFEDWLQERVAGIYGDPCVLVGDEARPYTLDNIVDSMAVQDRRGSSATAYTTPAKARSMRARPLRDIAHAVELIDTIVDRATFERERKEIDEAFYRVLSPILDLIPTVSFEEAFNRVGAAMTDLMTQPEIGYETVQAAFARQGIDGLAQPTLDAAFDLAVDMSWWKTEYFEAKVARAVGLAEFAAAVVPDNASSDLVQHLRDHGITVVSTYQADDPADRARVIQETALACGVVWQVDPIPEVCLR